MENNNSRNNNIFTYTGIGVSIISFIASVITIKDFVNKKVIEINSSVSIQMFAEQQFLKIYFIIFLIIFALALILLGEKNNNKNNNLLVVIGFIYGFIAISIYIVSAYSYIFLNEEITVSIFKIGILFFATFFTGYIIFHRLDNKKYFLDYSYFFLIGLLIVILFIFFDFFEVFDIKMEYDKLIGYLVVGISLFAFLIIKSHDAVENNDKEENNSNEDTDSRWD